MQILGMAISACGFLLLSTVLIRGVACRCIKRYPLFYSYLIYVFCGTILMYLVYWLDRQAYPSVYWLYFLITILAEFSVLIEISDHAFQDLRAVRQLGCGLTIVISVVFALFYMLPIILWSSGRRSALLGFALRASVTKAVILAVLFIAARRFGSKLDKNLGGLMLGFSIYVAVNIANLAAANAFQPTVYGGIYWMMTPLAFTLGLLVWTVALWEHSPVPIASLSPVAGRDSESVALELTRFNNELSRLLHK
jgi:hypothetical protein